MAPTALLRCILIEKFNLKLFVRHYIYSTEVAFIVQGACVYIASELPVPEFICMDDISLHIHKG